MKAVWRGTAAILASLLCLLYVSGCGSVDQRVTEELAADEAYLAVTEENIAVDNYFVRGANWQHFDEKPSRVVVTGENEIETLLELGLEKNILLAIASNSRQFSMREENMKKLAQLPKKNGAYLNMEYITQLHPDLIIAQQCIFVKNRLRDTAYWNERGVRTYVPFNSNTPSKHLHEETIEKEMQFVAGLGRIFHVEEKADAIISQLYAAIEEIGQKSVDMPKPKVMVVEFLSALISYDSTKLAGNMVRRIGGTVPVTPPVISFEHLVKENPDVLFVVCSHADYGVCAAKIVENPALQQLNCVKNQRIYSIPLRFTYGTAARTTDGLKYMAACMYQGCFPEEWRRLE